MIKRILLTISPLASIVYMLTACPAPAQPGTCGVGLIIGEPTGFSFKYRQAGTIAYDGAVAWSFVKEPHLHVHVDVLNHNREILNDNLEITEGSLILYYGIGGRLRIEEESRIGIRFVIGTSYEFEDAPFDAFFEIAPIMDIAPATELTGNAAIGMRYWF
ncbi:hypothetical protein LLG96_13420 [bacterium]|nr:hypothetical protein [bacterium]